MSADLLLAINAGNTRTAVALFEGDRLLHRVNAPTDPARTVDATATLLRSPLDVRGIPPERLAGIVLGSVVPALDPSISEALERISPRPVARVRGVFMPLRAEGVGDDRIANAIAAYQETVSSTVVIDFGTATTFTVVSDRGELLGGAIAPGLKLGAAALGAGTAQLPEVEAVRPGAAIGRDTRGAIASGIYWGHVGLVKEVLARIARELPSRPRVLATGGLAHVVARDVEEIERVDEDLTLHGLRMIWEHAR
ncbi:MAG: type III pantothenate kinase [Acidobacteriota bacterium]